MQRYFRDISTLLTHVSLTHDRSFEGVAKAHLVIEAAAPEPGSQAFAGRG
jgi:hypothetical protein